MGSRIQALLASVPTASSAIFYLSNFSVLASVHDHTWPSMSTVHISKQHSTTYTKQCVLESQYRSFSNLVLEDFTIQACIHKLVAQHTVHHSSQACNQFKQPRTSHHLPPISLTPHSYLHVYQDAQERD